MAQKNIFWKEYMQEGLSEKSLGALYFVILVPSVIFFIQGINARIGLSFLNPNIRVEIYSLLVILCIKKIYRVLNIWDFLFVIGVGVFCLFLSPSLYPETYAAVKMFGPYFVYSCLPLYFIGRVINLDKDYDLLIHIGRIGTVLNSILFILVSAKVMTHLEGVDDENMFLAYAVLPSVLLVACSELRKHNLIDFLLSLLGTIVLFALGTRGPVMALVIFVVVYLFFFKEMKYKLSFRIAVIVFLYVFILFSDYIFAILENIALWLGGSNRVFEHLQGGDMTNTDSRDWIYQAVIFQLSSGSQIGYGLFYDRTLFGMDQGAYCHNLFLELWLDFGYYIGSFLIIILMVMLLFNLIKNKIVHSRQLYWTLFCASVVQLLFSSSYLESPNFWFFIGVTVSSIANVKGKKYIHNNLIISK